MSTEQGPEAIPGFYHEELPRFDQRQAWTGRLERGSRDQFLPVGNDEVIRFPAIREHEPIRRLDAGITRAREIISTGTARVPELRRAKEATKELQSAIEELTPPSEYLCSVYEILKKTVEAEEIIRGNEIIFKAAGHIAAHNNLWVVIKSLAVEARHRRPRNIAVARLIGLTFSDTDTQRPVLSVVSGKNGKPGILGKVKQDSDGRMFPRALELFESSRSKSSH